METLSNMVKIFLINVHEQFEFVSFQVIMLSVLHIKDPDLHLDSQVLFQFLITNDNKITTLQVSKLSLIKTYWYIGS